MRKLTLIISAIILFVSCNKEAEKHTVRYEADNAISELSIAYMDESGNLIEITQEFNSLEDVWSYQGIFEEGEIVYLSSTYYEEGGSQRLRVLIDGKAWRQGQNEFLSGEQGRITLSGIVPIE